MVCASLRGLFDLFDRRWAGEAADPPAVTGFDLGTFDRLPCGDEDDMLTFGQDDVSLAVEPA